MSGRAANGPSFSVARRALAIGLVMAFAVSAIGLARGRGEEQEAEVDWSALTIDEEITVTGLPGVYGSEPHTYLALAIADESEPSGIRLVQLEGDLAEELWELQGRPVVLSATVTRLEIGPGFPPVVNVTSYERVDQP